MYKLVSHGTTIEVLSSGSAVHQGQTVALGGERLAFSSAATVQELYYQLDAGSQPLQFVFGTVAYSLGVGGNLSGFLKRLFREEVLEYSQAFDRTRHLALQRITEEAKKWQSQRGHWD